MEVGILDQPAIGVEDFGIAGHAVVIASQAGLDRVDVEQVHHLHPGESLLKAAVEEGHRLDGELRAASLDLAEVRGTKLRNRNRLARGIFPVEI